MNYISVRLYRKIIDHAINEGVSPNYFNNLPTPIEAVDNLKAVPAEHFFELHEKIEKEYLLIK